ncbi:MAG: hypothetical protein LCH84_06735 [Gemmatimonadetes bacterium]|nr:hypothetical protein [Gemmatimonadota bacterium]
MSLFATDAASLTATLDPWVAAPTVSRPEEALAELLPTIVTDALARGHVRAAAMAFEQAMALLPLDHPAMQVARRAIDACSAQDAARQQRHLAGELVVVPALTESAPGVPRFYVGATAEELGDATVQFALHEESDTGHQAELRNFLDEALLAHDAYVDLDPGAGFAVLSALTLTTGAVAIVQPDVLLAAFIARNASGVGATLDDAPVPHFAGTIEAACTAITAARAIVHLGRTPSAIVEPFLPGWGAGAVAVAWDATEPASNACTQQALEAAGFTTFMLAQGDEGIELRPWRDDCGAGTAFSLSDGFMATLGGDA